MSGSRNEQILQPQTKNKIYSKPLALVINGSPNRGNKNHALVATNNCGVSNPPNTLNVGSYGYTGGTNSIPTIGKYFFVQSSDSTTINVDALYPMFNGYLLGNGTNIINLTNPPNEIYDRCGVKLYYYPSFIYNSQTVTAYGYYKL